MARSREEILREIAKVSYSIEKSNEDIDSKTTKLHKLKKELGEAQACDKCLASLESLTDDNDFHTNCAKYICIYCRGDKECKDFTPYNLELRDKLNKIGELLEYKSDRFDLLLKLSTNEEVLDKILALFKELNFGEDEW